MKIKLSEIKTSNFRIGDILNKNGFQYEIQDVINGYVILRELEKEERVKSEFTIS